MLTSLVSEKNGRNNTTKAVGKEFGLKATAKIEKIRFFFLNWVVFLFYIYCTLAT